MAVPPRIKTPETLWLADQDPTQKESFLNDFTPKDSVHRLKGLKYPISNSNAVETLLKCQTNNKFLKRIQGKESSDPLTKADDLAVFQPEGPYGPTFFNKRSAVRLLNLAAVYSMTSRSRRSAAKLADGVEASSYPMVPTTARGKRLAQGKRAAEYYLAQEVKREQEEEEKGLPDDLKK